MSEREREAIWRVYDIDGGRSSWREVGSLVRCRDCVNHRLSSDEGGPCCAHWWRRVPWDGYCHMGEKKECER